MNIQDKMRFESWSLIPYKDFMIFWESLNDSSSLGLFGSSSERHALLIGLKGNVGAYLRMNILTYSGQANKNVLAPEVKLYALRVNQ